MPTTTRLNVRVVHAETRKGIPGARVLLPERELRRTTGHTGTVRFEFPEDHYSTHVWAWAAGFRSARLIAVHDSAITLALLPKARTESLACILGRARPLPMNVQRAVRFTARGQDVYFQMTVPDQEPVLCRDNAVFRVTDGRLHARVTFRRRKGRYVLADCTLAS